MCLNGIEKQPMTYDMLLTLIEQMTLTAKEALSKINQLETDKKILQDLVESFNKTNISLVKEIYKLRNEVSRLQNLYNKFD